MLVKHVIRTISKQIPATGRYNFPGIKNTNINNIAATTITNFSIKQCNNNNNNNNNNNKKKKKKNKFYLSNNKQTKNNGSNRGFNKHFFSTEIDKDDNLIEAELGQEHVIFNAKEQMKYWRVGGILSVFQFYSSAAMSAYLMYTSEPINMMERLGMSGLALGMTGIVLFGVHMVTRSIVVEIRQDTKIDKVEFTTIGLLGYNIKEYKISEMIDPFQNTKSAPLPGFLYIKHVSGSLYALQLEYANEDHLKDLYELSCI